MGLRRRQKKPIPIVALWFGPNNLAWTFLRFLPKVRFCLFIPDFSGVRKRITGFDRGCKCNHLQAFITPFSRNFPRRSFSFLLYRSLHIGSFP